MLRFWGQDVFCREAKTLRKDTNPREGHLITFPDAQGGVQKCSIPV